MLGDGTPKHPAWTYHHQSCILFRYCYHMAETVLPINLPIHKLMFESHMLTNITVSVLEADVISLEEKTTLSPFPEEHPTLQDTSLHEPSTDTPLDQTPPLTDIATTTTSHSTADHTHYTTDQPSPPEMSMRDFPSYSPTPKPRYRTSLSKSKSCDELNKVGTEPTYDVPKMVREFRICPVVHPTVHSSSNQVSSNVLVSLSCNVS